MQTVRRLQKFGRITSANNESHPEKSGTQVSGSYILSGKRMLYLGGYILRYGYILRSEVKSSRSSSRWR